MHGWKENSLIPFFGAGASLVGRPKGRWSKVGGPPTGKELARHLGYRDLTKPNDSDLAHIASCTEITGETPEKVRKAVMKSGKGWKNQLYEGLARLAQPGGLIVTTNYDRMIETAFNDCKKDHQTIVYAAGTLAPPQRFWVKRMDSDAWRDYSDDQLCQLEFNDTITLLKLHGSVFEEREKDDCFILTEKDYTDILSEHPFPTALFPIFALRRFYFMGYGLGDPNVRVLLRRLRRFRRSDQEFSWSVTKSIPANAGYLRSSLGVEAIVGNLNDFPAKKA